MGANRKIDAESLYPEATHGRLQDPNTPPKEHHEPGMIITREEEGSEELEREKKLWRDNFWLRFDDRLSFWIIFGTVVAAAFFVLDSFLAKSGFVILGYIAKVITALIILALAFCVIRSIFNIGRNNKKKKIPPKDDKK